MRGFSCVIGTGRAVPFHARPRLSVGSRTNNFCQNHPSPIARPRIPRIPWESETNVEDSCMSQVNESDGVRVVLSAPQLAAVLARQSISPTEMLSNRLWGGLQVVGGVLEMVGAGALCVLPEPTMASKAGCIVFGAHGSDTAAAGLRQVWTGQDTATLTQQGTTKLAEAMKASPDMANNIGLSLDIVVPFGFAGSIRAARAARVTMGRINLYMHEAKDGSR